MSTIKNNIIPKPAKKIPRKENKDEEHLNKWKKLFEKVDPRVQVSRFNDMDFQGLLKYSISEATLYRLEIFDGRIKMVADVSLVEVNGNVLFPADRIVFLGHDRAFFVSNVRELDRNLDTVDYESWADVYKYVMGKINDCCGIIPEPVKE